MIDKEVFAQGMGLLAGAFGREVDGPVSRVYYDILGSELSDAEWKEAVRRTVAEEKFWPSPAVIRGKVKQEPLDAAHQAFHHVNDTLNANGGYRFLPNEIARQFDEPTWAGIKAVGGLREFTMCDREHWPGFMRRFVTAYRDALTPKPALSSRKDQALPAGDRSDAA